MNRRKAIQNIAAVSAGAVILPSCDLWNTGPVYSNLLLESNQKRFIQQLSGSILPKKDLQVITPESTLDFILTMVNDCFSPEDIADYLKGLSEAQEYFEENYETRLNRLQPKDQEDLIQYFESPGTDRKELEFFYQRTKSLTIQHFTSSDFFMTGYLDYEMIPGRYHGCTAI